MATQREQVEVLGKLWEWAKKFLTPQDISNNLFLENDDSERTARHVAVNNTNTELWQKVQEWVTKNLATEGLNAELLCPNAIGNRPSGTWQQRKATQSFERNCGSGVKKET